MDSHAPITNINSTLQLGKRIWLTEFGVDSDDDLLQKEGYAEMLKDFSNLQIDGAIAWYWRGDVPYGNPDSKGQLYNLCGNDATGAPRPAYYQFIAN